jgi:hypothetical protein
MVVSGILIRGFLATTLLWSFETDTPGALPQGWETRGNSPKPVYQVLVEDSGNRYLAAVSRSSDVQLGVQVKTSLNEAPILEWRWRATVLPQGGDERNAKTLDSAASVYAVFGSALLPRILKYVWSTRAPAGARFAHPNSGRMVIFVVNSGSGSVGQWQQVRRDLEADYRTAFGGPPPNLIAIGVKTDSDSTRTSAEADYDDFRLTRR